MAGPSDPNSYGFFGQGFWGRKVFWEKVPVKHRQLDTDGHLEGLLRTWGDECESFLQQIGALPTQREPYEVRASDGEAEWFYFTESFVYEDEYWGQVIRLVGEKEYDELPNHDEDDIPTSDEDELAEWWAWWPYVPISQTARWWKCTWDGVPYKVVRVRTRSLDIPDIPYNADYAQANEVWLSGGDLRIFFDYFSDDVVWREDWTAIGSGDGSETPGVAFPYLPVRIEYNTTGAAPWLTADARLRVRLDLLVGGTDFDLYDVPDGSTAETGNLYPELGSTGQIDTTTSFGTINYQTGQIQIELSAAGDYSVPGTDILAKWYVRGYYLPFYPPRLIDNLARDFGFDNDRNDPEDTQRSTIANVTKYHGLKSTQDSYRIRGEISLFSVYARALWHMCDSALWASLSELNQFKYHGELYTDVEPRYVRFDDISGDQEFWNPDISDWSTLVDDAVMYLDGSTDGFSVALGFGLDVAQGYYGRVAPPPHPSSATLRDPAGVVATSLLTDTEAASYGFEAGYRVTVRMMRCQEYAFNWSKGPFGLTEYDKSNSVPPALDDSVFWIDAVDTAWTQTASGPTADEDVGEWVVIIGVGRDSSGTPYPGPTIGHADITAVNTGAKEFTISGDHTATITAGNFISVMRSTGNDGVYTIASVSLSGSDTIVEVVQPILSATVDGEMGWLDTAIRYYPKVDAGNCCYCKSYKMRVEIEPTAEAYDFYETEDALNDAVDRMKNKIAPPREAGAKRFQSAIIPLHARVVDWAITKEWVLENVANGNTIDLELDEAFLSDPLADVSAVDWVSQIFTINGDQRKDVAAEDYISIRGSTGNDDVYTVVGVTLNSNGEDTDVEVFEPITSAVADGALYPMPTKILVSIDQRGDMGSGQQQQIRIYDELSAVVNPPGTLTVGTGVSDPDTWYNVVSDLDVTSQIGNNSPVKIEAIDTGGITYGDVRFTFTVSKYSR